MSTATRPRLRRCVVAGSLPAILVFAALLVEGHPTRLLARGPYSSNFYEVQARMRPDC